MSVTKTPNLNLNLPSFNDSPWHDDVNDNFASIDATIKSIFGIDGLLGSYKNSTAVTSGQRYFDTVTGYYYEAQSSFTTEADPSTFAEERTAYPDRWELLDAAAAIAAASNAAASATQAASSATTATTKATEAATSATNAATSESNAATSATSASASAATATTKAAEATSAAASVDLSAVLLKANNLSGLTNTATARTNIGLGNVDNTSDANKPVSTPQQTAIDLLLTKADNLASLQSIVTAKTNLSLQNVNNTSDMDKPVSTAQQAALDALILGGPSLGDRSIVRYNERVIKSDITFWENNETCTVDAGADTINKGTDDEFADGDIVQFSSEGTLPAGLLVSTDYYVRDITSTTLKVATSGTGAAIDITDTGTGIHTIYKPINGATVGPMEIADGVTVNIKDGSTWSIM